MEKFANISQWHTKAAEDPREPPHHKYMLRGVSSSKDTTYVLESDGVYDDTTVSETDTREWQWWKLSYSMGQTPVVARSVSLITPKPSVTFDERHTHPISLLSESSRGRGPQSR